MSVSLVVDGQSEYEALPKLFPQLIARGVQMGRVARAPLPPLAGPDTIARRSLPAVRQLQSRGATLVVVLIDRERRSDCPGDLAAAILASLVRQLGGSQSTGLGVVVKNRTFENWLLADLVALGAQPARFRVTDALRRRVAPNKADAVEDAVSVMKSIAQRRSYDKVADSVRVLSRASVERSAANSRSFRRFLRVVGDTAYSSQSIRPSR